MAHGTFIATANELHGMFPPPLLPPLLSSLLPPSHTQKKREGTLYYRNISGEGIILYYSFILILKNQRRVKLQSLQFYINSKTINLHHVKSVIVFAKMVPFSLSLSLVKFFQFSASPSLLPSPRCSLHLSSMREERDSVSLSLCVSLCLYMLLLSGPVLSLAIEIVRTSHTELHAHHTC